MAKMKALIGEDMLLHLCLTGWVSTERGWHQDDYLNPPHVNSWYAAVWIALGDIHPDSGPFEYVPGSHRWPLIRGEKVRKFLTKQELAVRAPETGINPWERLAERFVNPAIEAEIAESGRPIVPYLAKRGDVLIWHGRLIHRGSVAKVPWMERRSLITHYSGVNHRPDMPDRALDQNGEHYAVFDSPLIG
jgi:ectoine hydroxylase-related dioxygenase (phytanoyl-CoA dioxygenase family)